MPDHLVYRTLTVNRAKADEAERTVWASVSSEEPAWRPGGWEVLSHAPEAVDLSRAENGLPVLTSHDAGSLPVGRAEHFHLEGTKLRAKLRFSENADAIWRDIQDGILSDLSIGYTVNTAEPPEQREDGESTYLVSDWTPIEVSLVACPADATVGIGRAIEGKRIELLMSEKNKTPKPADNMAARIADYAEDHEKTLPRGLVNRALREGWDVNKLAREHVRHLDEHQDVGHSRPVELGLSGQEAGRFSFVRALNGLVTNDWSQAGFEREVSLATGTRKGGDLSHLHIPLDVLQTRTAFSKGGTGSNIIATDLLHGSFIDILRNRARVIEAGAQVINGLVGDVAIPRRTTASAPYWVAEGDDVTESLPVYGQVTMSPNTLGVLCSYTRKMLLQSTPDIETLMRNDLAGTIASELDRVVIEGSGSGAEPEGILNTTGIGAVVGGENGAAPDWDDIVDLVKAVAGDNADKGRQAFMLSATARAKLQKTEKVDSTGIFIWEYSDGLDGKLAGFPALVTNQVPDDLTKGTSSGVCSAIIFGNWADALIGNWGTMELALDTSTNFASGGVRIRAMLDADVAIRHAESFAAMQDALCS